MEHFFLGGVAAGDKLYVVHQENIGSPVFFPEFLIPALPDRLDQFIGECVAFDVNDAVVGIFFMDGVGDGVKQVCFAQTGFAVDKQRIVAFAGRVGHLVRGGVGKLVGGAYDETLKGIFLCAGKKITVMAFSRIRGYFLLTQN